MASSAPSTAARHDYADNGVEAGAVAPVPDGGACAAPQQRLAGSEASVLPPSDVPSECNRYIPKAVQSPAAGPCRPCCGDDTFFKDNEEEAGGLSEVDIDLAECGASFGGSGDEALVDRPLAEATVNLSLSAGVPQSTGAQHLHVTGTALS